MRLSRRTVLGLAPAVLLVGCAEVPSSGPVVEVSATPGAPATGGLEIAPDPPAMGATPELILAGFLAASLVPTNNYAVARQFLTARASTAWNPASGVQVYDSDNHPPVVTDSSALLRAPLLGSIDAGGFYTSGHQPDFEHDFRLTEVGDQWRIDSPGDGVLVSRYELLRAYSVLGVHCLDRLGSGLVVQQVFLPTRSVTATAAVQALLRGASQWLHPAVTTAVIDGTSLATPAVTLDADGVAQVSLTNQIGGLRDDQRRGLAAQLLWTLNDRTRVSGLRIQQQGQSFAVPGAGADGVVHASALAGFAPVVEPTSRDPHALVGGKLVRLVSTGAIPDAELLPDGWGHSAQSFALSTDGASLAVVADSGTRLFSAHAPASSQPTLLAEGTALLRPQFGPDGQVWALDRGAAGGRAALITAKDGQAGRVVLPDLAGAVPIAARVAPGGGRLALVTSGGSADQLGFVRLRGNPDLLIDGWRPLTLVSSLGELGVLRDVAWISSTRLVVLGAVDASSSAEVFVVDVDASEVDSIGPGTDMQLSSLAALPTTSGIVVSALTTDGKVLVYQDGSRWQQYTSGASAICYQG